MTNVTVELLSESRRRSWEDIPHGQIFMGDGKGAPKDYPYGNASCGYGIQGPWLKIGAGLYDFRSGAFWPQVQDSQTRVWFENYHPLKSVKFVEGA